MQFTHTKDIADDFFPSLRAICSEVGADPLHVLSVMMSEAGVRASARNPNGDASGIIQFMPKTLVGLGWKDGPEAFRKLTASAQLPWVRKYFLSYRGKLPSVGAVYTATFLPALLKYAGDPNYVLTARDGQLGWAYAPNASLDANKDYKITVGELEQAVRRNCVGARWTELRARLEGRIVVAPIAYAPIDLRTTIGAQRGLACLGFDPGLIDGIPGPRTTAAVRAFQQATPGLAVDGIYGPRTRAALENALRTVDREAETQPELPAAETPSRRPPAISDFAVVPRLDGNGGGETA